MTTATASSLLEIAKSVLELSRRSTMKMVADISADKFCHQPVPGANHAMWILGHLANTDNCLRPPWASASRSSTSRGARCSA